MRLVQPARHPYLTLATVFLAWKALLLAIAAGSRVAPPYDSSASLLAPDHAGHFVTRLSSWDAIYFLKASERGYLFEQEWAFGSALPYCISLLVRALKFLRLADSASYPAVHLASLAGVLLANVCHFGSALLLYKLGLQLWADDAWALVSALLHVLSPAGLFLSAPYAESPFSLLCFLGWLLLAASCSRPASSASSSSSSSSSSSISADALTLLAGLVFGIATVFRTNGLLNGTPFAFEFVITLYRLVEDLGPAASPVHIRRLAVLAVSGLAVAAGSLVPQFLAYRTYCRDALAAVGHAGGTTPDYRPWCHSSLPSIYNFVQRHYWNTGFLKYWTLSNSPLFLLAAPMLFIMAKSGKDMLFTHPKVSADSSHKTGETPDGSRLALVLKSMAVSQVLVAILALTSYHVQIITRLSSGYPVWYWWAAACLKNAKTRQMGRGLVLFAVMYAAIQGVLFASFLPPA